MNKKIYIIANWKMQLTNVEAAELAYVLKNEGTKEWKNKNTELILCPSFTALLEIGEILQRDSSPHGGEVRNDIPLKLGAQNVFYHEKGQYTGEISPVQLKELGVEYVIIGHSERRQYLNETDEDVNRKMKICLENDLIPIVCIGETFTERRERKTEVTIIRQLTKALEDITLKDKQKIILAYEPVWAISPAPAASPAEVKEIVILIEHLLRDFFDEETIKEKVTIIYGGSVDASNILDYLKISTIEGALVGGASLKAEKFLPLVQSIIKK